MRNKVHPLAPVIAQIGRTVTSVTTRWVDCHPSEQQRIYYANHTSHLDTVVLWSSFPKHIRQWVRPVGGVDYWTQTWLRKRVSCKIFNSVLVERNTTTDMTRTEREHLAQKTIQQLSDAMGERYSLIVFPEGTRGDGESVAPFKSGIYHLCQQRPDIEIVPAYIENLNRVLPKGEVLLVPVICSVTFGAPLRLASGETKAGFLTRAKDALCRLSQT